MDRVRPVLWFLANVVDDGLELLRDAKRRVMLRRFLKDHPQVTVYPWTDGTD